MILCVVKFENYCYRVSGKGNIFRRVCEFRRSGCGWLWVLNSIVKVLGNGDRLDKEGEKIMVGSNVDLSLGDVRDEFFLGFIYGF